MMARYELARGSVRHFMNHEGHEVTQRIIL